MANINVRRGPAAGGAPPEFRNRPSAVGVYVDGSTGVLVVGTSASATSSKNLLDNATAGQVLVTPNIGAATGISLQASSFLKSSSPAATGGVGYSTGAGGLATQITNRSTGVAMVPNPCMSGAITTDTTSLAAEASADFIVTNSAVAIGDVVVVSIRSGSNSGGTAVSVSTVTAGTFTIRVTNNNAAAGTAETGAIIINFAIIKAVSA